MAISSNLTSIFFNWLVQPPPRQGRKTIVHSPKWLSETMIQWSILVLVKGGLGIIWGPKGRQGLYLV